MSAVARLAYNDTTVLPNENKEWITGTDWLLMLRMNFQYFVYAKVGGGLFSMPGIGVHRDHAHPGPARSVNSTLIQRDIDIAWTAHPGAVGWIPHHPTPLRTIPTGMPCSTASGTSRPAC